MQAAAAAAAWLLWAVALVSPSRADPEAVQPLRCYACAGAAAGAGGACASAARAVLCPREQPYCATRASSPGFTSVLSCSAAVEGVCSLSYSGGTYEMTCVCSAPLCNAPFSHKMQTELIHYTMFNSASNSTQHNKMFWKLSHLANGSDANIYNKITEKTKRVTEAPPRREGSEWMSTRIVAASTMTPGGNLQRLAVPEGMRSVETNEVKAPPGIVQKVEQSPSQPLRQAEAQIVLGVQQDEEPRAQAVRQLPPTVAPSDDEEDEGEGSGADEEAPRRRAPPTGPAAAAPNSYLPADGNHATPLFFNLFLISSLLLYTIV